METKQSSPNQNFVETESQPQQISSVNNKLFVTVAVSILLTTIVAGSVVYFWQKSANEKAISGLGQKIISLEKQLSTINKAGITATPTPSLELSPTSTLTTKVVRDIVVDYSGIDPNSQVPNATGNITPEIKQAIEAILKSESHVFTDRNFFTFAVYLNYGGKWIDAAISAPESQNFITLQGEPYSRIILQKTSNEWTGHLACSPGYLQMLVNFYQSDYIESAPELISNLKSRLAENPNATDIGCKN